MIMITYHDLTSYDRGAMSPHMLDWANQPSPYKAYESVETIPLPKVSLETSRPGLDLLQGDWPGVSPAPLSHLDDITRILTLACAPTTIISHASGKHILRSNPSAGALYPTEVYFACSGIQGLKDGLFHYDPLGSRLHLLRKGNLLPYLSSIMGFPSEREPVVCFFLSAIIFRSAWKYRARSYRYHLLDTGHVIEGLELALQWLARPLTLGLDFDDDAMNRLLGLDATREPALAAAGVCSYLGPYDLESELQPLNDSILRACRVSAVEVNYPDVRKIHEAGKRPRTPAKEPGLMVRELGPEPAEWIPWPPTPSHPRHETPSYPEIVKARRSRRNFIRRSMKATDLSALLASLRGVHKNNTSSPANPDIVAATGMLVGRVEGTPPGNYLLEPRSRRMGLVSEGDHTSRMARICLDQSWLAGAALHIVWMANLAFLDETWGPRGYRYTMLAAGRLAHRVYLTATALGLGCCGIGAFYDGEAAELLSLRGSSRLLYLVAVGPLQGGLRLGHGD